MKSNKLLPFIGLACIAFTIIGNAQNSPTIFHDGRWDIQFTRTMDYLTSVDNKCPTGNSGRQTGKMSGAVSINVCNNQAKVLKFCEKGTRGSELDSDKLCLEYDYCDSLSLDVHLEISSFRKDLVLFRRPSQHWDSGGLWMSPGSPSFKRCDQDVFYPGFRMSSLDVDLNIDLFFKDTINQSGNSSDSTITQYQFSLEGSKVTLKINKRQTFTDSLTYCKNGFIEDEIIMIGYCAADVDGDKINNCWEMFGIDQDCDGVIDYKLPDASPEHKDIYVEVDALKGAEPKIEALKMTVDAFKKNNIRLHIPGSNGQDPGIDEIAGNTVNWEIGEHWKDFNDYKKMHFGQEKERKNRADSANIIAAKARVFRYGVFAHTYDNSNSSGIAKTSKGKPCQDFLVTLGAFGDTKVEEESGTFMHELGHTLGLQHGGGDDKAGKPNYYSVMNYLWQMPIRITDNTSCGNGSSIPVQKYKDSWDLIFSDTLLPTLKESGLNESLGIQGPSNVFVPVGPPNDFVGPKANAIIVPMNGPVNWDRIGDPINTAAKANVNFIEGCGSTIESDYIGETLLGFNDWKNLRFELSNEDKYSKLAGKSSGCLDFSTFSRLGQLILDCNLNSISDETDILSGESKDANSNGVPDECEKGKVKLDCALFGGDADLDGVCGNIDNCPFHFNPEQLDTDLDNIGDSCDYCPKYLDLAQNYCLEFVEINDYAFIPGSPTLELTVGTIEFWVSPKLNDNSQPLLSYQNDDGSRIRYRIDLLPGLSGIGYWNGRNYFPVSYSFQPNQWYHLALFAPGNGTSQLYVNGALIQEFRPRAGFGLFQGTDLNLLLCYNASTNESFAGKIDELRIWDYVKSLEELEKYKTTILTGTETGLIGYWPMNEGQGDVFSDKSGHIREGFVNSPTWSKETNFSYPLPKDSDKDKLGDECDLCPFDPNNHLNADGTCANIVSIKEANEKHKSPKVYPNPTQNELIISQNSLSDPIRSISIFNQLGKVVFKKSFPNFPDSMITINLKEMGLSNGWYILGMQTKNRIINQKFLLVKQ